MPSLPLLGWTALLSAILWTFYLWICLLRNYLVARKVGVPLRMIPVSHGNPFWMLVDRKIVSLCKRLPFGDNNFTRYNWRGWEVEDRYRSHLEMGGVWMQVTSGKNWLYLCDPDALLDVFKRRADFPRPLELYRTFIYGRPGPEEEHVMWMSADQAQRCLMSLVQTCQL